MKVDKPEAPVYLSKAEFRRLAKVHHPDRGGDPEKFMALVRAREEAADDCLLDMIGEEE